jgi:hypothetical protein
MQCLFCGKVCEKIQETDELKRFPVKWQCYYHPYVITYWTYVSEGRGPNLRYDFRTPYKDKIYRWYFHMDEDDPFSNIEFALQDAAIGPTYPVFKLNCLPHGITPENALDKLPIFLSFS